MSVKESLDGSLFYARFLSGISETFANASKQCITSPAQCENGAVFFHYRLPSPLHRA